MITFVLPMEALFLAVSAIANTAETKDMRPSLTGINFTYSGDENNDACYLRLMSTNAVVLSTTTVNLLSVEKPCGMVLPEGFHFNAPAKDLLDTIKLIRGKKPNLALKAHALLSVDEYGDSLTIENNATGAIGKVRLLKGDYPCSMNVIPLASLKSNEGFKLSVATDILEKAIKVAKASGQDYLTLHFDNVEKCKGSAYLRAFLCSVPNGVDTSNTLVLCTPLRTA